MLSTHSLSPSIALQSLAPVLNDETFFTPEDAIRISSKLRPQIEQAIQEIEAQLLPIAPERLRQIVSRLMLHFPYMQGNIQKRIFADYTEMLAEFPEDLLCAAYQHALRHHTGSTLPKIADLIAFMEPELNHRRLNRRKLDILKCSLNAEGASS